MGNICRILLFLRHVFDDIGVAAVTKSVDGFSLTWKEVTIALVLCVGTVFGSVVYVVNAYSTTDAEAKRLRCDVDNLQDAREQDRATITRVTVALEKCMANQAFILKIMDRHDKEISKVKENCCD